MTDIDQYHSRIMAALARIERLDVSGASNGPDPDAIRERERTQELIEELEAALGEERAVLQEERAANRELKAALAAEQAAHGEARRVEDTERAARDALDQKIAASQETADTASGEIEALKEELTSALTRSEDAEAARLALATQQDAANAAKAELEAANRDLKSKLDAAEKEKAEAARSKGATAAMEEKIVRLLARVESQDQQFQRLKDANATLRDSNAVLREKNLEHMGDASAVNASMAAELEALRSTRAAEVDEMDTILEELKPLMEGRADA